MFTQAVGGSRASRHPGVRAVGSPTASAFVMSLTPSGARPWRPGAAFRVGSCGLTGLALPEPPSGRCCRLWGCHSPAARPSLAPCPPPAAPCATGSLLPWSHPTSRFLAPSHFRHASCAPGFSALALGAARLAAALRGSGFLSCEVSQRALRIRADAASCFVVPGRCDWSTSGGLLTMQGWASFSDVTR